MSINKRSLFLAVSVLLCWAVSLWGQEGGAGESNWTAHEIRVVDEPGEVVAILENGMTAIVKENHVAPVAAVRLYVRAGSIYEKEHLGAGISHLFEHLLAGGSTKTRTEDESKKIIQEIGARYNAYTSKDKTCYYLTVPSQHIGRALNLIADWVTRPTFPEKEFDREWGVVQRELEMGATDPDRMGYKFFDELRYTVHPARYPIIGYQEILQQVTREEILAYYRQMYVPDNCVLSIVGDINAEEMLSAVKKEFSDFKRRSPKSVVLPEEPDVTAPRRLIKYFEPMKGPAKVQLGFPSIKLQDKDLYSLDVLAGIMGTGQSSRLYRSLREEQQLVLTIYAYNYTPQWAKGTFVIGYHADPAKVDQARKAVRAEIEKIKREGVSEQELARIKRQLQVDHIRNNQTAQQQAQAMARDYLSTSDAHFSAHYVDNIQQVTAGQVREVANRYLLADKELYVVMSGVELPGAADKQAGAASETPIKKIELDNGLRVLLKRNASVPLVDMQMYVMGGLFGEKQANNGLTNLMARMSVKGTKNYSLQQINEYFDGIGGSIGAQAGNNTFYYSCEVMSSDFADSFKIFSEVVLAPTFPDEELAKLKDQVLAAIEQIKNSWPAQARLSFRRDFFQQSPYKYSTIGSAESVSGITPDQLAEFHKQSAVGCRSVLAIFGDIDMAQTERMVREYFSSMPKGQAVKLDEIATDGPIAEPRRFREQTAKEGATIYVGYPGLKLSDIQDRYVMDVLMEIVGGSTSEGWFFERLRGAQLVYYAWAYNFIGLLPGYVCATAQCESGKVDQVLGIMEELFGKATKGEFTEEQVARAKSRAINSEILEKQTNADAAYKAALDELYGFGYKWSEGHPDRIMAVTLEQVKQVAAKYFSQPATISIIASENKETPADEKK